MSAEQLERLCRVLRPLLVGAGEALQQQGGAAQGVYIVRWGRLAEKHVQSAFLDMQCPSASPLLLPRARLAAPCSSALPE